MCILTPIHTCTLLQIHYTFDYFFSANQQIIVNGGNEYNQNNTPTSRNPPPPVAPKPSRNNEKRNTVDNLLDQLEGSLPERSNNYSGR